MTDDFGRVPQGAIDAARAYEELHVPALFGDWAARTAEAAAIGSGASVLDIACGTGVLARHAYELVGDSGFVAGVDLAPGMLAVAREIAPSIEWHLGDAATLPFADDRFDAVVSQFGLMFFPDRISALREMHRVLAPDGRLAVAVWGPLEAADAYRTLTELFEELAGPPAADALRAPFVLGDRQALHDLVEEAGVRSPEVETLSGTADFPSLRAMVEAELRGWLPLLGVELDEELIETILERSESVLADHVTDRGRAVFNISAHIATGAK